VGRLRNDLDEAEHIPYVKEIRHKKQGKVVLNLMSLGSKWKLGMSQWVQGLAREAAESSGCHPDTVKRGH